jgi:hypothetical protein
VSVTNPTLKFPPPLDELVVLLEAPALPAPLELALLLLLLPHAASPRASAAVARATGPESLILPVTTSPFRGLRAQP